MQTRYQAAPYPDHRARMIPELAPASTISRRRLPALHANAAFKSARRMRQGVESPIVASPDRDCQRRSTPMVRFHGQPKPNGQALLSASQRCRTLAQNKCAACTVPRLAAHHHFSRSDWRGLACNGDSPSRAFEVWPRVHAEPPPANPPRSRPAAKRAYGPCSAAEAAHPGS